MDYSLNNEEMQAIQNWLDGETEADAQVIDLASRLFRLSDAVRTRLVADSRKTASRYASARKKLERLENARESHRLQGDFEEYGYDSWQILKIIFYCADRNGLKLSSRRAIAILYLLYSSVLAKEGKRLTVEHPVANINGPQFWGAANALSKNGIRTQEYAQDYRILASANPGLAEHINNAVKLYGKYYEPRDAKDDPVCSMLIKSAPYRKASRENNCGKWNGLIKDEEIYDWKKNTATGLL